LRGCGVTPPREDERAGIPARAELRELAVVVEPHDGSLFDSGEVRAYQIATDLGIPVASPFDVSIVEPDEATVDALLQSEPVPWRALLEALMTGDIGKAAPPSFIEPAGENRRTSVFGARRSSERPSGAGSRPSTFAAFASRGSDSPTGSPRGSHEATEIRVRIPRACNSFKRPRAVTSAAVKLRDELAGVQAARTRGSNGVVSRQGVPRARPRGEKAARPLAEAGWRDVNDEAIELPGAISVAFSVLVA
jgi:hypothetical protein